jgi:hypothetical protein
MKKISDAADPLHKTLDDGQKRRLAALTHYGGFMDGEKGGWRQRWMERGMGHDGATVRDGDHGGGERFRVSRSGRVLNQNAVGFRRLFNHLRQQSKVGKNPLALLDIGRSLC